MNEDYIEYIGFYHRYSNGEVFSLLEFNTKLSIKLIKFDLILITQKKENYFYSNTGVFNPKRYKTPMETTVVPNLEDYKDSGFWKRYFIRKVNDINWGVREINHKQYIECKSKRKNAIDYFLFNVTEIPWKLTGELNDKYNNGVLSGGVFETNLRTIKKYSETFKGLDLFLTDPTEFTFYSNWYKTFIFK